MGNSKSHQLKEEYINKNFKLVLKNKDNSLGNYDILDFKQFNKEFYIRKIIDPQDYDRFADINEFVKNLSKTDKRICDFYFVEFNQKNSEMFDLIFEYGIPVDIKKIESQKELLILIKSVIKAMEFLQNNNMHYPLIHKNFLMAKKKNYYKLINPYCFKDYLKDVLEIYMNPMNSMKLKNEFCEKQIKRNVNEFGKMLMTFLGKFDEKKIYNDKEYLKECLKTIDSNDSFLIKLINFVLKKNGPKNFHEIKKWFDNNIPQENSVFKSFLSSGLKLLGKKEEEKKKKEEENLKKIQTENQKPKKQHTIFGNYNERKDPILQQNLEIGVQIQKEAHKEEKENFLKYRKKVNEIRKESEEKKRSQTISSNDEDLHPRISNPEISTFDNIEDEFFKTKLEKNTNFFPDQNVRTTNFEIMNNVDFFENPGNLKQKLKRKKSLNNKPLIGNLTNNLEFLNKENSQTNITNYLKTKEKRKSNSAFNDLESYYINEVDVEKKDDMQFAKYLNEEYETKKDVIIENKIVESEQKQENENIQKKNDMFKKKMNEKKIQPQQKTIDSLENDFQPPVLNRKIKRVLLKWVKSEGKYQKTIEYSDGTTEIVEINDQENNKYKNSIRSFDRPKPQAQVKITPFAFLLYPTIELPPILLFSSNNPHVNKIVSTFQGLVDKNKINKPSRYHMVDEEGLKPVFDSEERFKSLKPKQRHIMKSHYER